MSNSWALRGIKAILRNKRVNKPRLKDRSWQLKLRQKNRYITALENRTERLESEVETLRRSCRVLGHQIGKPILNQEIFDLLVNGGFSGGTGSNIESVFSGMSSDQIIGALKEAALKLPKLSPYQQQGMLFESDEWPSAGVPHEQIGQPESLFPNPIIGDKFDQIDQQGPLVWKGINLPEGDDKS